MCSTSTPRLSQPPRRPRCRRRASTSCAEQAGTDVEVDAVLTEAELRSHRGPHGRRHAAQAEPAGQSARQAAAAQAADGFEVWRSWDEAGGIRDELYEIAADNPQLVKLEVLGETHEGRELIAEGHPGRPGHRRRSPSRGALQLAPARPRVDLGRGQPTVPASRDRRLAGQRPRDQGPPADDRALVRHRGQPGWLSVHVRQRTPVAEEPAYNDGDGQVTRNDGVDLNRNFDEHFRYDEEGSSSLLASDTYAARARPPSRRPRPCRAWSTGSPKFVSNWHSFGRWILYPQGWQIGTPDADNPIYTARRAPTPTPPSRVRPGHQRRRAVRDQRGDHRLRRRQRRDHRVHPRAGRGHRGVGFRVPGRRGARPGRVRQHRRLLDGPGPLGARPGRSASPVGDETEPFYLDQAEVDDENSPLSMFDFTFDVSYGDPQEVRVLAKRDLGPVTVKFRINGGDVQSAPTTEWTGGERYGVGSATYYHVMSGQVTGTGPQHGGGVVRSGRRAQRLVHVHGRVGDRHPAPPRRRGLHRRLTRLRPDPAVVPVLLHRRTRRQRRGARRVRRRRQRPDGPRRAWRAEPLRRRGLVHGQRHHHPRTRLGRRECVEPGDQRALRGATSSTRAGALLYTGKFAGTSTRRRTAASSTTRSTTHSARRTRRSRPCAAR